MGLNQSSSIDFGTLNVEWVLDFVHQRLIKIARICFDKLRADDKNATQTDWEIYQWTYHNEWKRCINWLSFLSIQSLLSF